MARPNSGHLDRGVSMNNVMQLRSATLELKRLLRKHGIASTAEMTFEFFPELLAPTEGLVYLLSDRIPFPFGLPFTKQDLASTCVRTALEFLDHASVQVGATARSAQTAYMAGLLFRVPELATIKLFAGGEVWDMYSSEPLTTWAINRGEVEVGRCNVARTLTLPQVRGTVLHRIVDHAVLGAMDINLSIALDPPEFLIPPKRDS